MVTKGEYMAIVAAINAEQFIDECEELLLRGWEFHGTVISDDDCWIQVFKLIGEFESDKTLRPAASHNQSF